MTPGRDVDGVLVQWGERLFYPANRIVRPQPNARLDVLMRRKAAVKITGGGRGIAAIAAHFRYISKSRRLNIEDDRGVVREGKDAVHDLADQWRYAGTLIDDVGYRREGFNIMLSMPQGTDPRILQKAAREFAQTELNGHRYVMVLHDHQANPHVHLSVRAEAMQGDRLNPRKNDLHRWREIFAEKLRGWGIEAEATRQATRGANRHVDPLWRVKAKEDGRLNTMRSDTKSGERYRTNRMGALKAWANILKALQTSEHADDRQLAGEVRRFVGESPFVREEYAKRSRNTIVPKRQQPTLQPEPSASRDRRGPEIER
jgi:hypothetical protein